MSRILVSTGLIFRSNKVDAVLGMFLLSRDSFDKYVCQQALG